MGKSKSLIVIFFIVFFFLSILSSCYGSSIPPAKIESFSEVKTIKVLVEQSYYDDKGNKIEDFSMPIHEMCGKILRNIGIIKNILIKQHWNGTGVSRYWVEARDELQNFLKTEGEKYQKFIDFLK
jgi:hypothetical protein